MLLSIHRLLTMFPGLRDVTAPISVTLMFLNAMYSPTASASIVVDVPSFSIMKKARLAGSSGLDRSAVKGVQAPSVSAAESVAGCQVDIYAGLEPVNIGLPCGNIIIK